LATIQWLINGNVFSNNNNPGEILPGPGIYEICLLVVDFSCTLMPTQLICDTLYIYGVKNQAETESSALSIRPNPAHTEVHVEWIHPGGAELFLYDMQGRCIRNEKSDNNKYSYYIERDNLPAGMYILQVQTQDGNYSTRVIFRDE